MAKEFSEDDYKELQETVAAARTSADKAQGALDELNKRLRTDYGCKNLAEAEKKLRTLRSEAEIAKEAFDKQMAAYEKEWSPKNDD